MWRESIAQRAARRFSAGPGDATGGCCAWRRELRRTAAAGDIWRNAPFPPRLEGNFGPRRMEHSQRSEHAASFKKSNVRRTQFQRAGVKEVSWSKEGKKDRRQKGTEKQSWHLYFFGTADATIGGGAPGRKRGEQRIIRERAALAPNQSARYNERATRNVEGWVSG